MAAEESRGRATGPEERSTDFLDCPDSSTLIFVAARWTPPALRTSPLVPYARDAADNTLELLENALAATPTPATPHPTSIPAETLLATVPQDVRELMTHLQARAQQCAADARQNLQKRGQAEAAAMREILQDQQKRISRCVDQYKTGDLAQITLSFDQAERRQLEADHRYWAKRLANLDREIAEQPQRIADVYNIHAQRVEPVGLVYLLPGGA